MGMQEEWEMQCPRCNSASNLHIHCKCYLTVLLVEDGTEEVHNEGHDWDSDSSAECVKCGWKGTVGDLSAAYENREVES